MTALGQWVVIADRYDRNPPMELYGPYEKIGEAAITVVALRTRDEYEAAWMLPLQPRPEPEPDAS